MYAVVDIETTGGNAKTGRITEVAIYRHNGNQVVDAFTSLVRPGCPIPPFVVNLTGITNQMVSEAPRFDEIAEEINQITAGCIFVAHNVAFDYEYIRQEFKRIGMKFTRRKLCTVQLSRQVFEGLPSYSLGKLTRQLNIKLDNHHRAAADALATVKILEKIIADQSHTGLFDDDRLEASLEGIDSEFIDEETLGNLPDEAGVYRLLDADGHPLFVKRSLQLSEGILAKLKNNDSRNIRELKGHMHSIAYEPTGSTLLAGLMEIDEVVRFGPHFNHDKFTIKPQACISEVKEPSLNLPVLEVRKYFRQKKGNVLAVYKDFSSAREALGNLAGRLGLEVVQLDDDTEFKNAFNRYLSPNKSSELMSMLAFEGRSFLLRDEGPEIGSRSFIKVVDGNQISVSVVYESDNQPLDGVLNDMRPLKYHPAMALLIEQTLTKTRGLNAEKLPD